MESEYLMITDKQDTYCELGEHTFKVVLNQHYFKNSNKVKIKLYDPSGKEMQARVDNWGRKMFVTFNITNDLSNGVAIISIDAEKDNKEKFNHKSYFWLIIHR